MRRKARIDTVWLPCAIRERRLIGGIGNSGEGEGKERQASYYAKEESGKQGMLGLIEIDLYRWMEFESRK